MLTALSDLKLINCKLRRESPSLEHQAFPIPFYRLQSNLELEFARYARTSRHVN
jgi:hypothetical protein